MSCFTLVFYCHIFISQQFNLMSLLKRIWTHNWRIKESQLFNLLRSAVNYFHSKSRGLTIFGVLTQEKQKNLKIYSVNICFAEMLVCWHSNSLKTRLSSRNDRPPGGGVCSLPAFAQVSVGPSKTKGREAKKFLLEKRPCAITFWRSAVNLSLQ